MMLDIYFHFYPSALRAGGVLSARSGRAGGWPGGQLPDCGTHISVTAWRIFSVPRSVELSRPVVVHCHLPICPIWACPWAKNLSNLPQIGSRLCGMHISETAGWIYPIWSFVDLSRLVVVQHNGHWTLALDFQGQILKMLYLRNGRADWHGIKGMWVDRMLHSHCDLNFDLIHDLDLGFSRSVFEIVVSQEREGRSTWNERDMSRQDVIPTIWPWAMTLTLDFEGQILKKLHHRNKRVDWHGIKRMSR